LASKSDGVSGVYIAKAVAKLPSVNYSQTIGVFGLIVAIIAMALKDIQSNIKGDSLFQFGFKEISSFFAKFSSDLLLVTYGVMSFILGVAYFYYFNGMLNGNQNSKLLILTPFYLFFVFLIAFVSIVIRSSKESQLSSWWMDVPAAARGGSYLVLIVLLPLYIWHHK